MKSNSVTKIILPLLILLLICGNHSKIYAAGKDSISYKEYQGIIKNADNGEALPFASIIVEGSNVATVSNLDGEFTIKVNDFLEAKNLLISSLGYKNRTVSLADFKEGKPHIVLMDQVTEFIKELTVRPSNASEIMQNVINNISKNYSNEPLMMKGFYRETIKNRRNYVSISEAVVDIYKASYSNDVQFDQVKIDKGRKSSNVEKMDTIFVRLQGGPTLSLLLDVMKNPYQLLTEDYLKAYDFEFDNVVSINDRLHYVISFIQKPYIDEPYFYGKYYVDIDKLAISEAEFALNLDNKEEASNIFIRKKPAGVKVNILNTSYRVSYTIQDNKWFFNYARGELKFKLNWRKKLFNSNYTLMSELAITDRDTQNVSKIDRKFRFMPSDFMEEQIDAFIDPDFWGNYNLIEPDQSIESAIKKLYRQNN